MGCTLMTDIKDKLFDTSINDFVNLFLIVYSSLFYYVRKYSFILRKIFNFDVMFLELFVRLYVTWTAIIRCWRIIFTNQCGHSSLSVSAICRCCRHVFNKASIVILITFYCCSFLSFQINWKVQKIVKKCKQKYYFWCLHTYFYFRLYPNTKSITNCFP